MGDETITRVLRTGGPLSLWRKEVERQGEDPVVPVLDMLGAEGVETLMETLFARLEDRFSAWVPSQYIENFPEEQDPQLLIKSCVDEDGLWVSARSKGAGRYSEVFLPLFMWSPKVGYVYDEPQIFRFQFMVLADVLDAGDCNANVKEAFGEEGWVDCSLVFWAASGTRRWHGLFEKEKVFDYNEVQALVRRILAGEIGYDG